MGPPPVVPLSKQSSVVQDEPEEDPNLMQDARTRTESHGSGGSGDSGGSGASGHSASTSNKTGSIAGTRTSFDSMASPESRRGSSQLESSLMSQDSSMTSNISLPTPRSLSTSSSVSQALAASTSRLRVPLTNTTPSMPGPRTGSSPSVAALMEGPSTEMPPPRLPLSRKASSIAQPPTPSAATSTTSLNILNRKRTTSGPIVGAHGPVAHRKGETPAHPLKAHTCAWDFEVEHTLRIPLFKPIQSSTQPSTPGTATPTGRSRVAPNPASTVGAGPLSESGLRLIIYQIPSSSATASIPATGANKDSLSSVMHAAHTAAHHVDGKHGNPSEGRQQSASETYKTMFGSVDIDLAAFAGKGLMTRKFLLRGSRTNATIKVSVNMQWVGGEERWVAPPLSQGHHVTGIHDLVNNEAEDRIRGDLSLAKTSSSGSSGSSLKSGRTLSNPSSGIASRNESHVDLTEPPSARSTKSYEQHLQASDATRSTPTRAPRPGSSSRNSSHSHHSHNQQPHHAHMPLDLSKYSTQHRYSHHRHHVHHLRDRTDVPRDKIESLPAELIIEAIFNPRAASEESPFTYIPKDRMGLTLEGG